MKRTKVTKATATSNTRNALETSAAHAISGSPRYLQPRCRSLYESILATHQHEFCRGVSTHRGLVD